MVERGAVNLMKRSLIGNYATKMFGLDKPESEKKKRAI